MVRVQSNSTRETQSHVDELIGKEAFLGGLEVLKINKAPHKERQYLYEAIDAFRYSILDQEVLSDEARRKQGAKPIHSVLLHLDFVRATKREKGGLEDKFILKMEILEMKSHF